MTAAPAHPVPRNKPAPARPTMFVAEYGVTIPATAFTLGRFRRWAGSDEFPERGRVHFLNGEVYVEADAAPAAWPP